MKNEQEPIVTDQPRGYREANGAVHNGKFRSVESPEPPAGGLGGIFDRNDGSFLLPSPSKTAEHCLNFWNTVQVSDATAKLFERTYANRGLQEQSSEAFAEVIRVREEWIRDNPDSTRTERVLYWKKLKEDAGLPSRPFNLNTYEIVPLIRAAQMYYHAPSDRFPEARQAVMDHQIELLDETLTVREVEQRYRLASFHHVLETEPSAMDMSRLEQAIGQMENKLSNGLAQISVSVGQSSAPTERLVQQDNDRTQREIAERFAREKRQRHEEYERREERIAAARELQ